MLVAVAPVVGLARVAAAAPELALALGYDVESPSGELSVPDSTALMVCILLGGRPEWARSGR